MQPTHARARHPITLLILPIIFGMSSTALAEKLPSPKTLFKQHVEAVGGKRAIKATKQRTLNGTFTIAAMGLAGPLNTVAAAPNKIATSVDMGQFGVSRSGFDGVTGWSMDARNGNQVLAGDALAAMQNTADFYSDLNLGKDTTEKETVGVADIDGEPHYRVRLVNKEGDENYLYFSKKTGLLGGIDRMDATPMGKVPTQVRMRNYVKANGLQSPRAIATNQNGIESVIQIESISYGTVKQGAFEVPPEIRSVLDQQG